MTGGTLSTRRTASTAVMAWTVGRLFFAFAANVPAPDHNAAPVSGMAQMNEFMTKQNRGMVRMHEIMTDGPR